MRSCIAAMSKSKRYGLGAETGKQGRISQCR